MNMLVRSENRLVMLENTSVTHWLHHEYSANSSAMLDCMSAMLDCKRVLMDPMEKMVNMLAMLGYKMVMLDCMKDSLVCMMDLMVNKLDFEVNISVMVLVSSSQAMMVNILAMTANNQVMMGSSLGLSVNMTEMMGNNWDSLDYILVMLGKSTLDDVHSIGSIPDSLVHTWATYDLASMMGLLECKMD